MRRRTALLAEGGAGAALLRRHPRVEEPRQHLHPSKHALSCFAVWLGIGASRRSGRTAWARLPLKHVT